MHLTNVCKFSFLTTTIFCNLAIPESTDQKMDARAAGVRYDYLLHLFLIVTSEGNE